MTTEKLSELHKIHIEKSLFGRYINSDKIGGVLQRISKKFRVFTVGYSEENRPIFSIELGRGNTKVLMWSQMHGNESTTTKALFDLLNVFNSSNKLQLILEQCTLQIIPMLNPDGAERYTRLNANKVDLNRDAQNLTQLESKVLQRVFKEFKPHYCFNLHGQRTIFGAGKDGKSATLSFLSPAEDEDRTVTETRKQAMSIIAYINNRVQKDIPNGVGRYDDGFNLNCVGDTFTHLGVPTVLYEAGHYPNDYGREVTRELIFKSLYYGLEAIITGVNTSNYLRYFEIPENKKNFFDVIIRNAKVFQGKGNVDVAIQFKEVLENKSVEFVPEIAKIENLEQFFAHKEVDAHGQPILNENYETLQIGHEIVCVMLNNRKILLKS